MRRTFLDQNGPEWPVIVQDINKRRSTMSSTDNSKKVSRRQLIARLGMAAGAAYVAPAMLGMHAARASTGSAPSRRSAPSARSAPTRRSNPSQRSAPTRQSNPTRNSSPTRNSTPSRTSQQLRSVPSTIRLTQRELEQCQRVQAAQPASSRDPIWVLRQLGLC
jgi:hypothetical protein